MKMYSFKKIMDFIEKHKDECDTILVGMSEDWNWTSATVWKVGKLMIQEKRPKDYFGPSRVGEDGVHIAGIEGSRWATPWAIALKYDEVMYEEEVAQ